MIHENEEAFFASVAVPGGSRHEPGRDTPLNEESTEVVFADTKPDVTILVVD